MNRHDSRALWKYNLSDSEFQHLKNLLRSTRHLSGLDPRDCALYYAEWWKRCYEGGVPSKQMVFASFQNNPLFDAEDFFQYAKKGAKLLGVRWTRHIHTLYFKTLLQQGGLPILHIRRNNGAYKTFLLRILALRPKSIDDFAFDTVLTSLLPLSSRNDQVYECCLAIVQAILSDGTDRQGHAEVLTLLEETAELTEIVRVLRAEKERPAEKKALRKVRASWVLEPEKKRIRLYLTIGELSKKELLALCGKEPETDFGSPEYRLFYNDELLCKLVRRGDDMYRTVWVNQDSLFWEAQSTLPEVYLLDIEGNRYDCTQMIPHSPRLDRPTLWTQYSENQFLLARGNNTEEATAYLLGPENCDLLAAAETELIEVAGSCLYWTKFEGTQTVWQKESKYLFSTNCPSFQWSIAEDKPVWMRNANLKVVRNRIAVQVSDKEGKPMSGASIRWKRPGESLWQPLSIQIPLGIIHLKIQLGAIEEYDKCYNIGSFNIAFQNQQIQEATLLIRKEAFRFSITEETTLLNITQTDANSLHLQLSTPQVSPIDIACRLDIDGQRPLRFSIYTPFKGLAIVDKEQHILSPEKKLSVSKLYGYRILTNEEGVTIRLRNSSNPVVTSIHKLTQRITPLRFFEDKINHLLRLSRPGMPAIIEMEIGAYRNGKERIWRTYTISKYEQQISEEKQNGKSLFQSIVPDSPLWAIPLGETTGAISIQALEHSPEGWILVPEDPDSRYLVFGTGQEGASIEPTLATFEETIVAEDTDSETDALLQPENPDAAARERINKIRNKLIQADPENTLWKQLHNCYQLCLEYNLSFASFDLLQCIPLSGEIAAKAFVYFLFNSTEEEFDGPIQKRLEDELGFCFHWIAKEDWGRALFWMSCFGIENIIEYIPKTVKTYFEGLVPATNFKAISRYILEEKPIQNPDFHLKTALLELRTHLGEHVLTMLPKECPKIGESFKQLIPVDEETHALKVLLKAPVAVALSITGKDNVLWSAQGAMVRRSIQYCYQLHPQWYAQAICYCLSRL